MLSPKRLLRDKTTLLILAILAGFVVAPRLASRDVRGLWEDEVISYIVALGRSDLLSLSSQADQAPILTDQRFHDPGTVMSVLQCARNTEYPPLYYLLLHGSIRLSPLRGPSLVRWLTLWNVVFAALTAMVILSLCRRARVPDGVAFLASALWGLSAWDLAVGLQLKAYALGSLLTVLGVALAYELR